ncbi:hypothetical protein PBY51_012567 [Eleginops maclovinus]|uniref:Uncharacterized protein n=1 Tax=Eleginops maclovinus TaxID=56733 RepID=A0AAN7Y2J4_ELEMC|nr:hypothetical protein PBY51_012567 [Eleginops maclovinus]
MTGRKSGVVARAKERNPMMIATHYMLHMQALASKSLSPELHSVLSTVVSVVNHIKCKSMPGTGCATPSLPIHQRGVSVEKQRRSCWT